MIQKSKLKYGLLCLITWMWLLVSPVAIARSQNQPDDPFRWNSYGLLGSVVYAPVRLDGYDLFVIATEREKDGGQWGLGSLEVRRDRIENRLKFQMRYLLENATNPESLQVVSTQLNKQIAVQAILDGNPTKPIVTITALDAEVYGLTEAEVAEEYARQIRQGLLRAIEERQPAAQQEQRKWAVIGTAITALLIGLLFGWQRQVTKARRHLRQEFHNQKEALIQQQEMVAMDQSQTETVTEQQQQLFDLKSRIDQKTWRINILRLLVVAIGIFGLAWVLQQSPQSRSLGILITRQPIGLLLIGLSTIIAITLSHVIVDKLLTQWIGTEDQFALVQIERRRRRFLTLSPIWKKVLTLLWLVIGLVVAYSLFSLSTGLAVFTGIGVLGLTVSLAFQSSIKDALTGWMLLAQDAFTVGDIVTIKDISGVVEAMGLLMTQIRSSAGDLITLRNSEITHVINRSKDWSRLDFTVLVDYDTDVKQALTVMENVFQTMRADPEWGVHILSKFDVLGVEQFDQNGLLLKIRAQTQAGQQFNVTREFRLRLNQAFKEIGIKIPVPQREVRYRESQLGTDASTQSR